MNTVYNSSDYTAAEPNADKPEYISTRLHLCNNLSAAYIHDQSAAGGIVHENMVLLAPDYRALRRVLEGQVMGRDAHHEVEAE